MALNPFASQRALAIPPSGIRKFFDIAATMDDVISLGIGEPDFDTPAPIVQAGIAALERGETHYTSNSGLLELREAIADHLRARYGLSYEAREEILITVGVSEAFYLTMAALLDPGDEIIMAEPCFVSYAPSATLVGAKAVLIPTSPETGFQLTADAVEAAITERTKVIFLASPNNPTGTVLSRERMEAIAALVEAHDLIVISDEIYDRLVYGTTFTPFASIPGMRERTLTLQGFSKAYAMTGWRVGYVAGPPEIVWDMRKIHQYLIMSAPTASQWAALKALEVGEPFIEEMHAAYDRRRQLIVQGLNDLGLLCTEPHGAFYAFPCITSAGMDDNTFAEMLLQEEQVAVVPGRAFGESGVGFVRMSYATAYDQIEEALVRIGRFVQRHRQA